MKTKTTTIGSRFLVALLVCGALACLSPISGKDKKKKNEAGPQAVIAGTVFTGTGFALGGADILLTPDAKDGKERRTVANDRGEFALRVPAVPMKYRIDVKMRGFQTQTKDVTIEGEQRKELNFLLEAAKQASASNQ